MITVWHHPVHESKIFIIKTINVHVYLYRKQGSHVYLVYLWCFTLSTLKRCIKRSERLKGAMDRDVKGNATSGMCAGCAVNCLPMTWKTIFIYRTNHTYPMFSVNMLQRVTAMYAHWNFDYFNVKKLVIYREVCVLHYRVQN